MEGKGPARHVESCKDSQEINPICKSTRVGCEKSNLKIIYTNADCLSNKRTDLKLLIDSVDCKPDVIAITEVNSKSAKNKMQESEFYMDDYEQFSVNIGVNNARGIMLFVNKSLVSSQVDVTTKFEECLFVHIKGNDNNKITIGVFYRSPSSLRDNDEYLCNTINQVMSSVNGNVLLLGDFNYPGIDWNSWNTNNINPNCTENCFLVTLQDNLLMQHVDRPTRARGSDTPHILDLILSNDDFVGNLCYLSPLGSSDHSVLEFTCEINCTQKTALDKLDFNKANFDEFREYLNRDLVAQLDKSHDVNSAWLVLKSIIMEGINRFIPKVSNNSWRKKLNWRRPLAPNIRKLIKSKHRLWTRYCETKSKCIEKEYKNIRNKVKAECRKLSQKEQNSIAVHVKDNPKKFWKFVNSKTKSRNGIGDIRKLNTDGTFHLLSDDSDKCKVFSEFISEVYTVESKDAFNTLNLGLPYNHMAELCVSDLKVFNKLSELKVDKSPGPDLIHPRVLYETRAQIASALKLIFQMSLDSGKLPCDWKKSTITMIHKKGNKSEAGNYRPISLTCICCKIFESIIKDHIIEYFTVNNLFSSKQFGFIKGRSTTLQLLNLINTWSTSLEYGGQIDVVYTDFEKAFDKIPHRRLMSKLYSYGFNEVILSWIKNFLFDRQYQVKINDKYSDWSYVTSGVPQGSVLGPILFVIYINDLPQSCADSNTFLFADDAKMFKHIKTNSDELALLANCQKLYIWCEEWLMKLNTSKCKVLSIGRNIKSDFKYGFNVSQTGFVELDRVENITDLGVIIDHDLSFKCHIYDKINTAYKMLGVINRNFKHIDKRTFLLLYKSLVRSHLEYAQAVWSPYKSTLLKDIERVQKRATKMVAGCRKLNYKQRLQYIKLPTLKFRRVRGDMIETYKILSNCYDKQVSLSLPMNVGRTRGHSLKLKVERAKYDLRKYSFPVRIVNVWNALPDEVVLSENINSFKNRLDKLWMDEDMYFDYEADLSGRNL